MSDIKSLVRGLNQAWVEARYDELYQYFHKDVLMLIPGVSEPLAGINALVESYRSNTKLMKDCQ